ncbi:MAG: extracellular catalytic domain type 1 short-chain-length polyhydroxyalkanoate depolymerase [Actinomycetota bacterium]
MLTTSTPHRVSPARIRSVLAALAAAAVAAAAVPSVSAASVDQTIEVGGIRRTYVLHVPAALPANAAVPLVFVLHGGGGAGRQIERETRFSDLADRNGFIAIYPDGIDRSWNDGRGDPQIGAQRANIDDVAFIAALIEALSQRYRIDPRRVYSTGISNGGFMSQLLAARLSGRIAAIAPVAGGMGPAVLASLRPEQPVSVLMINGTADRLVPYAGGPVARNRGATAPVPEIVQKWAEVDRCAANPPTAALPDVDPADGSRVKVTTYSPCAQRTEVVLYTIDGGGHTWPGGSQYLPRLIVGPVNRDINASEVIWKFFADHPRP